MSENIHAAIRAFLQQRTIPSLHPGEVEDGLTKAGVVPFVWDRGEGYRFYVMKPQGRIPGLDAPLYQLCKGTRMYRVPGVGWRDMRADTAAGDRETLAETALREGMEELGLRLPNIAALFEMGPYDFSSATTGKGKRMWLFAAEMSNEADFAPDAEVAFGTGARAWLTSPEFAIAGREDHRYILRDIEEKLTRHFKE